MGEGAGAGDGVGMLSAQESAWGGKDQFEIVRNKYLHK